MPPRMTVERLFLRWTPAFLVKLRFDFLREIFLRRMIYAPVGVFCRSLRFTLKVFLTDLK